MSLTKQIHEANLTTMKEILNLGELSIGKGTGAYLTFKKVVMDSFKKQGEQTNAILVGSGVAQKCECGDNLDNGPRWTSCPKCAGCGVKVVGG